ncbi:MAG: V-type ATP synthase subunit F [Thermoplasmata archaeon]
MDEKNKFGKIAFLGERELAIGFKLVGVENVFIASSDNFSDKLKELYFSGIYGLILVSNTFIDSIDKKFLNILNTSVSPLVVFIPVSEQEKEENISELARRVLGIKLDLGGL